jgi:hypothetical protein
MSPEAAEGAMEFGESIEEPMRREVANTHTQTLAPADIAELARAFTVHILCN